MTIKIPSVIIIFNKIEVWRVHWFRRGEKPMDYWFYSDREAEKFYQQRVNGPTNTVFADLYGNSPDKWKHPQSVEWDDWMDELDFEDDYKK